MEPGPCLPAAGLQNLKYADKPLALLRKLDPDRRFSLEELDQLLPPLEEPIQRRAGRPRKGGTGGRRLEPRSAEDQAYYKELWRQAYGLELLPGNRFYWCPKHGSKSGRDDLHVDDAACVHHCFGGCGLSGGIRELEVLAEDKELWGASGQWQETPGAEDSGQPGEGNQENTEEESPHGYASLDDVVRNHAIALMASRRPKKSPRLEWFYQVVFQEVMERTSVSLTSFEQWCNCAWCGAEKALRVDSVRMEAECRGCFRIVSRGSMGGLVDELIGPELSAVLRDAFDGPKRVRKSEYGIP